ncbi:unnamed protein product [Linum trigynum]|uniref:Uncharacterized protein n=1 Tax=Linum trigynum TaxID=586398 RepID=A0AAV2EZP6_9ROSI
MEQLEKKQQGDNHLCIDFLDKYGPYGKLDPVTRRQQEIKRVVQFLYKCKRCNPCLVGDPDVGKTVIVEGLAAKIVGQAVPPKLLGNKVL